MRVIERTMSPQVLFVTQELEPWAPGGAGAVVRGLMPGLGSDTRAVFATPLRSLSMTPDVRYVELTEPDGTIEWFVDRSRMMAAEVAELTRTGPEFDVVEFTDFEGAAIWALTHRQELGLGSATLAVRLHGPIEAIRASIGVIPHPFDLIGILEREALTAADAVVVPSPQLGEWAVSEYMIEPERIVVSPPPVPPVTPRRWMPTPRPSFVHYGRVSEQKGVDLLAEAIVPILDADQQVRLTFVGADGWSGADNRPMSSVVLDRIPTALRDQVDFLGPLDRDTALDFLMTAWAVALPTRFETFCLAAHEVRRAGAPLIIPSIPAFDAFDRHTGALKFNNGVDALRGTLEMVVNDRSVAAELATQSPPVVGDPLAAYFGDWPLPRSQASQLSVGSRALERVAEALATDQHRRRRSASRRRMRS